ncbi:hypothetical protein FC32_GL001277 [Ligilactobacillus apodemi DSM 16634 = JCM 16172]|uniref:Uncharacterized protein n=2 Tax=Ligilactobacillus TaxID=2767887 RepID=A0A0R1TRG3_9LACO|nr:hypothetical protein FC32_GL001277 [Ligilactobacillus apodemi DSM 16634 = JCM 16172]
MSEEMHVVDFLNDLGTAINFYGTIDNGVVIDSGNLITSSYELKKYISDFLEDVAEDMAFDVLKFV